MEIPGLPCRQISQGLPSRQISQPVCSSKAQNKLEEQGINLTVRHTFIHMDFSPSKSLRRCSSDPMVSGKLGGIEPLPKRQESQPNPVQRYTRGASKEKPFTGIPENTLEKVSEGSQYTSEGASVKQVSEGSQDQTEETFPSIVGEGEGSQDQIEEAFPSIGSMKHYEDECRACAYFYKKKCLRGYQCLYCHFPHEISKRPGKNTRRRNRVRNSREQEREDEAQQGRDAKAVDNGGCQSVTQALTAHGCPQRQLTSGTERWSDVAPNAI